MSPATSTDSEVFGMYDYRRGGGVLLAFLLGGVLGAVLGLLFAPRSGKESRDMIADGAQRYWDQGVELYGTGVEKVTEMYESGKETAGSTTADLRVKIDAARDRLQDQVAETVPAAKGAVDKTAGATKGAVDKTAGAAHKTLDSVAEKSSRKKADKTDDKAEDTAEAPAADEAVPEV
jgi:gas vesicle protein